MSDVRQQTADRGLASGNKLIVGLGNHGPEYVGHRHNVGFQCLDRLAEIHVLGFMRLESRARLAQGVIQGVGVLLVRPLTYMNLSGQAVGSLVRRYGIPLSALLVIYDDMDLPLGTIRLRPGGGAGGHKGMRSIINALGSQEFPRLRVGIGRPLGGEDAVDYVLSDFTLEERVVIEGVYERVLGAVECWLREGIVEAMGRYNCGS
jgi:PTH1 family peptidyl-tRNA hydrolase